MDVYTCTPKTKKEDGNTIAGHTMFNEPLAHLHHQVGCCTLIKKDSDTLNVIVEFSASLPLFPLKCDSRRSGLGYTLPLLVIKIQAAPARKMHLPAVPMEGSESKLQATQPSLWTLGEHFFFMRATDAKELLYQKDTCVFKPGYILRRNRGVMS